MKRPTIAVDIDDVLTHSAEFVIEFSNATWGTVLTLNEFDEDWRKMWGIEPGNEAEMHRRSLEIRAAGFKDVLARNGAGRVLGLLQRKARIVAITSRRRVVEPETREWIDQHLGGVVEEIHFAGIFDDDNKKFTTHEHRIVATKHEILSTVKPDYFIDDQLKHCEAALKLGIKTIVFGDYAWNRNTDIETRGAVRCASWDEVEEYFIKQGIL